MTPELLQRYHDVGQKLATLPDLFPGLVAFLEAIADSDESRAFILCFHEWQLAHRTTRAIADALCTAVPRLTELEHALDTAIERMSATERHRAAFWAFSTIRGHEQTRPDCVAQLLTMLVDPPESLTPERAPGRDPWLADAVERCGCDETLALRVELAALTDVLCRIARLCGHPGETRADTVLAHVESVTCERDQLHANFLAYRLVDAAPELCEVRDLPARLASMARHERLAAETWASHKLATCGELDCMPTMPACVLALYRAMPYSPLEPDA